MPNISGIQPGDKIIFNNGRVELVEQHAFGDSSNIIINHTYYTPNGLYVGEEHRPGFGNHIVNVVKRGNKFLMPAKQGEAFISLDTSKTYWFFDRRGDVFMFSNKPLSQASSANDMRLVEFSLIEITEKLDRIAEFDETSSVQRMTVIQQWNRDNDQIALGIRGAQNFTVDEEDEDAYEEVDEYDTFDDDENGDF